MMQIKVFIFISLAVVVCIKTINCGPTKGSGHCPLQESVKICLPKCFNDYECVGERRCCKNSCGTQSCADVSPVDNGNDPSKKSQSAVVTCANEKCLPGQKCKSDNSLKRPKCTW